MLRGHLGHPLPDLVAEVRRLIGVDCEVRAALPGARLDRHRAARRLRRRGQRLRRTGPPPRPIPSASVVGLLAYLDAAAVVENGLAPAQIVVAQNRVQVLTVHAAKGLEWQVVAVPHLSGGLFPSTAQARTWLTDAADLPPLLRGDRSVSGPARRAGPGHLGCDRSKAVVGQDFRAPSPARATPHRRGAQAAVRGHHPRPRTLCCCPATTGAATGIKPRGPSDFLCELKDIIDQSAAAGQPCGVVEHWAPAPADGDRNPLRDSVHEATGPSIRLAERRADVQRGAALVAAAMSANAPAAATDADAEDWAADVDALLNERARAGATAGAARCPADCRSAAWWTWLAIPSTPRSG